MEAPAHIQEGLRNISPGMRLVWNPTARVKESWGFDVNGNARHIEYDPRWELWDTDGHGVDYKLSTLEGPGGTYVPPGEWLLELRRKLDPNRFGGDITKLVNALVEEPNLEVERLSEESFKEFVDALAEEHWGGVVGRVQTNVPVAMNGGRILDSQGR